MVLVPTTTYHTYGWICFACKTTDEVHKSNDGAVSFFPCSGTLKRKKRRSLFGCTDEVKTSCRAVDAAMKGAKFMPRIIRICHGWGIGFWLLVQVYATLSTFLFFRSSSSSPFSIIDYWNNRFNHWEQMK